MAETRKERKEGIKAPQEFVMRKSFLSDYLSWSIEKDVRQSHMRNLFGRNVLIGTLLVFMYFVFMVYWVIGAGHALREFHFIILVLLASLATLGNAIYAAYKETSEDEKSLKKFSKEDLKNLELLEESADIYLLVLIEADVGSKIDILTYEGKNVIVELIE